MTPTALRKASILAIVFVSFLAAPSGLSARGGAPPSVTADPDIALVPDAGSEAAFAAAADGSPVPAIQWQVAPDRFGPWTDIPGATTPTLTFTATDTPGDVFALGNAFRAVFTNSAGTTQSGQRSSCRARTGCAISAGTSHSSPSPK